MGDELGVEVLGVYLLSGDVEKTLEGMVDVEGTVVGRWKGKRRLAWSMIGGERDGRRRW